MATSTALEQTLTARVIDYSARVRDDVLLQHEGSSVHSSLGVWLLLCLCLSAAEGSDRAELEAVLGSSQAEARQFLHSFLQDVPAAIKAAVAVWARAERTPGQLDAWLNGLPEVIGRGPIPTVAAADRWASDHTSHLIQKFPVDPEQFDLLIVSALATRVSWKNPYEVSAAAESFSPSSPWVGAVDQVLWMDRPWDSAIINTAAAGLVAVHRAVARENLVVICVSADPQVSRSQVLAAAHEVNNHLPETSLVEQRSLFDLPLGAGHSWIIKERERKASHVGERFEHIADVCLPAWEIRSELNLKDVPSSGVTVALDVMAKLIGDGPSDARQVAVAWFDRYGFEAAAVTVLGRRLSGRILRATGIERTASLRFDHPFAALAVCAKPGHNPSRFAGLPVFEAWVNSPSEVPGQAPHL